jgi:hypothetical protein
VFRRGVGRVLWAAVGRLCRRYAASISGSIFIGLKRASRLRFWAVAARRNSSLAPFGPLRRKRVRRRIRLRCANSISTFFRRRQASTYSGVAACAQATSRASSCRSRADRAKTRCERPYSHAGSGFSRFYPLCAAVGREKLAALNVSRSFRTVCAGSCGRHGASSERPYASASARRTQILP